MNEEEFAEEFTRQMLAVPGGEDSEARPLFLKAGAMVFRALVVSHHPKDAEPVNGLLEAARQFVAAEDEAGGRLELVGPKGENLQ
jgi:hypothetical protein